ncbi:MAG: GNAT family N-acetyltransferase [Thermoleophilia bacterium]|jgi:hypothetical protein
MWRIDEYRGKTGLEQLEVGWKQLYATMDNRSYYHAYEAHHAYLSHLCAEPASARYLVLMEDEHVRAICPLQAGHDTILGRTVRAWTLPLHPHWQITDVIAPDGEARRMLIPAVTSFLRKRQERRRLLVLGRLPQVSSLWEGLRGMGPTRCYVQTHIPSNIFDCTQPYDELMGRLSKNFRRNLRARWNKLQSLKDVRFVTAFGPDGIEDELKAFMTVEASGWKGRDGTASAIKLHPDLTAFYHDIATTMYGDEDRCEINSLYAEGHCLASQFCIRTGDEYAIVKIGYDETFAKIGPGHLLFNRTLQRCCEDATIRCLDVLSDAPWFKDWRTTKVPMQQAHVAIGCLSGRPWITALNFRHGPARRIVHMVRNCIARWRAPSDVGSGAGAS